MGEQLALGFDIHCRLVPAARIALRRVGVLLPGDRRGEAISCCAGAVFRSAGAGEH